MIPFRNTRSASCIALGSIAIAASCCVALGCGEPGGAPPGPASPPDAGEPRVPTEGLEPGDAIQVASGATHTCALTLEGAVLCWGSNSHGQLGTDEPLTTPQPAPVPGLESGVREVFAGYGRSCAILETGAFHCWGSDVNGPEVNAWSTSAGAPTQLVGSDVGVIDALLGFNFTCVLTRAGGVYCWGSAGFQLGDRTLAGSFDPLPIRGLGTGVVAIDGGDNYGCALTEDSRVWCWGNNANGELGDGTNQASDEPLAVRGLEGLDIVSIASAWARGCALTREGSVWCWGADVDFCGSTTAPELVFEGDATSIGASGGHVCAVESDGEVWCWGSNNDEQLANAGAGFSACEPVLAEVEPGVLQISPGGWHTCALLSGGRLQCWGNGQSSQLGGTRGGGQQPRFVEGFE